MLTTYNKNTKSITKLDDEKLSEIWNTFTSTKNKEVVVENESIIKDYIKHLDDGIIRAAYLENGQWIVNDHVKMAISLYFVLSDNFHIEGPLNWFDKVPIKRKSNSNRRVPGSVVRYGSFLEENVIVMPAFINIGAYVGKNTMIDTWSTIGSCAQIGSNCHISGGVGIGGVLEPVNSRPVIIEDNCFIGARSEIAEGVIVEKGSVISMGVFISGSTKIIDRNSGEIFIGKVPEYSVVIPGSYRSGDLNINCGIIIKKVDERTRSKTSINEILRM